MAKKVSERNQAASMLGKLPPLESSIVSSILRYLNSLDCCYAVKTRGDYRQSGQPDIMACYKGRMLVLEVKRPGGKPTPLQMATLGKWKVAGAVAEVVYGVEQVKEIIKSWENEDKRGGRGCLKKEISLCDRCGKEGAKRASIFVERVADAAGSMENKYQDIDLCHECSLAIISSLTLELPRNHWIRWLKELGCSK